MKKYFAHYLPVEGKVEAGDYCIDNLTKEVFKMGKGINTMPKNLQDKLRENATKVKLFLCSRDIQVGDKCIALDGLYIVPQSESDLAISKEEGHFKVIGEISPDATWVKEGDEFDEDEIMDFIMGDDYYMGVYIKDASGNWN